MLLGKILFHKFKCELPHILQWHEGLLELGESLRDRRLHIMQWHEGLRELGNSLRGRGFPVNTILYEELKAEPRETMKSVAQWLGLSQESTLALLKGNKRENERSLSSAAAANVTDLPNEPDIDLKDFDEYRKYVSALSNPGKDCLLEQLYLPDNQVFPVCEYPFAKKESPTVCAEGTIINTQTQSSHVKKIHFDVVLVKQAVLLRTF